MSRGVIINNEGALESVLNITTIRALDGDTAYIGEVWISNLSDDDIDAIKTAIEAYSPGGGGGEGYAEGVAAGKAAIATSQKLDIANYQVKLRNYDQDIADANIDTNKGQLDVISESYQFIKTPDEITQIQNTAYNNGANEARHLIAMDHQPIAEEYKSILSNVPEIQEQDPTDLIGQRNIFSLSADYLGGGATGTPFTIDNVYIKQSSLTGNNVWSDGDNIYYSGGSNSTQYVLNKETSTWNTKTWSGLTTTTGNNVWTDGDNIYYSTGSIQRVLNKETSTWTTKTWSGLTSIDGSNVWSDGDNIYYSTGSTQYVLNKETSTWTKKTWTGLTSLTGYNVWTDSENIYYSSSSTQYVLDKETSTWTTKTWSGSTSFEGRLVWTDGENIYYSSSSTQRVLNKETSTWSSKAWGGSTSFDGTGLMVFNPLKNHKMSCRCSSFGQDRNVNIDEIRLLTGYKFYKDTSGVAKNMADTDDYYTYMKSGLVNSTTIIVSGTVPYRLSNVNMSFIPK